MKATMKKVLAMLLVVTTVAAIAVGGTLAYLTMDAGDETNVFSVGNIDVSLDEEVGIYGEGGEVKETEDGAEYIEVMPGDYLKKEVTVTNNGKTDAYVAVTVKLNNADKINAAIDEVYEKAGYTAEEIQAIYDDIFDGWGINYNPRPGYYGVSDARGVIDGTYGLPEHVLHVDFAKTTKGSTVIGANNWFIAGSEKAGQYWVDGPKAYDGYYTADMEDYEICYTYYLYLPAGESSTLFNGLNVPAEFDADQLAMFDGLKIDIEASAIQADNMAVADEYANDKDGEAKTAFAILAGDIETPEYSSKPEGTVGYGYTAANKIWGESTGNAKESFVLKVYSGNTYMGSTSLNNVDGIIDGDVTATWNIALNGQSTDYWTMSWENVPTINLQPTKVELWIDGVKVDEGAVQLNGPDDLNPIVGAVVDANGTILRYVVKGTEPNVTTGETYVPFNSNTVTVEGTDLAALSTAIGNAQAGDTVKLTGNIDIGANPLAIEKNVILDLNGKTISADNRWGVISLKNGASIKNGNIDVKTNVAAIRAFNVGTIENVTIKAVAKDENKVVTAIAVQNGGYVGTIKNVTITGATQGIEVLKGAKVSLIENANVQAVSNATKEGNALIINAGYVGKAVNSTFNGSVYGVHMMLNGEYNVALALENCDVTGATAGIYAHDEVGISNTTNCSLTLTYDAGTKINGGLKWDFEEECQSVVTLNKP